MEHENSIADIAELSSELSTVLASLLVRINQADSARAWEQDGATSCAAWLVAHLGIANSTARAWTETASALRELPATAAAFAEGRLSYDQVRTICRFATPESDVDLAEASQWMSVGQLGRIARRHAFVDLNTLDEAYRRRHFEWRHDEERHTIFFRGQLPDDRGAVVVRSLERLAYTTPHDPDLALYDGFGPRAADALYAMASQSLGVDTDPDRATVVVHVPAAAFAGAAQGNGVVAGGPALHPESVRRLACDGRIQFIADDVDSKPVGIGRTSRQIPPWLKRLIEERDHGCRFPGCSYEHWVHAHHIVHWSHGGPTDLDNLITLCGFHHRLVHERGWRISGDPQGDVAWVRPNGSVYQPTRIERDLANLARAMRGSATADTS